MQKEEKRKTVVATLGCITPATPVCVERRLPRGGVTDVSVTLGSQDLRDGATQILGEHLQFNGGRLPSHIGRECACLRGDEEALSIDIHPPIQLS